MKENPSLTRKWKTNIFALLGLILIQVLALLLLSYLLAQFIEPGSALRPAKPAILSLAALLFAIVDLTFLRGKVILLGRLLRKAPVRCTVEDIVLMDYKEDGRTRYSPYLLVRCPDSGKRYFTYDSYALLGYNAHSTYERNQLTGCAIYRKDRTPVKLGDPVDVYLLKTLSIPVSIDAARNTVKLKNRKIQFNHMNGKVQADVFRQTVFFQGAIDVDVRR